jgi:hypothetical protein
MKLGNATLKIVASPVTDAAARGSAPPCSGSTARRKSATEEEIDAVVKAALDGDLLRRVRRRARPASSRRSPTA